MTKGLRSHDNLNEMQLSQHLCTKGPSLQPSTCLATSSFRRRQSWESLFIENTVKIFYQGGLAAILGSHSVLVKHRTSSWEFICKMCSKWIRIKKKLTNHIISKHLNVTITRQGHSGDFGNGAKFVWKMSKSVMQLISIRFWNVF